MEVGNLVLNKSLVRTRKLLEDAVNGVRSASRAKSIELAATLPDDLPDVEADKEMVRVVVTNLLSNGIKYTQDGGNVFLTAEAVAPAESETGNGSIVITVTDNGPGIPEDEQANRKSSATGSGSLWHARSRRYTAATSSWRARLVRAASSRSCCPPPKHREGSPEEAYGGERTIRDGRTG